MANETSATPGGPVPGAPVTSPPPGSAIDRSAEPAAPAASPEMEEFLKAGLDGKPPAPGTEIDFEVPETLKERLTDDVKKMLIGRARDIARIENIPPNKVQAILQGLVEAQGELTASAESEAEKAEQDAAEELVLAWKREIASDPQLGGAKYTSSMVLAEDGARRLGGHVGAVAFLRHLRGEEVMPGPLLVRMFHLAGATMKEDRIAGLVMKKGPESRTLGEALYGKSMKANGQKG